MIKQLIKVNEKLKIWTLRITQIWYWEIYCVKVTRLQCNPNYLTGLVLIFHRLQQEILILLIPRIRFWAVVRNLTLLLKSNQNLKGLVVWDLKWINFYKRNRFRQKLKMYQTQAQVCFKQILNLVLIKLKQVFISKVWLNFLETRPFQQKLQTLKDTMSVKTIKNYINKSKAWVQVQDAPLVHLSARHRTMNPLTTP